MSLEIQTSSGPRHVSTALVKSTDDGRHGNKRLSKLMDLRHFAPMEFSLARGPFSVNF